MDKLQLNAQNNCLGAALTHIYRLSRKICDPSGFMDARTVSDVFCLLGKEFNTRIIVSSKMPLLTRLTISSFSWIRGYKVAFYEEERRPFGMLVLLRAKDVYDVDSSEYHWIYVNIDNEITVFDDLAELYGLKPRKNGKKLLDLIINTKSTIVGLNLL